MNISLHFIQIFLPHILLSIAQDILSNISAHIFSNNLYMIFGFNALENGTIFYQVLFKSFTHSYNVENLYNCHNIYTK